MRLLNELPYPVVAFRQFDINGGLDCVVAVRGTFVHRQGEAMAEALQMKPSCFEHFYDGDPHTTCLVRQADLTSGNAGTDVTADPAARRWEAVS